ncbi:MAG: orotidine-5'-phosphate decarboxylase [Elusimicrobia bacterium]|nr:orotidine-5'-phosphate decarboxylase [Elusimicrobiota bacterium]
MRKTELITALDLELDKAEEIVKKLSKDVKYYKIGPVLFMRHGVKAIDMVKKHGGEVFLDLKLHDIPNTVKEAIENANKLGIYSISMHILGGPTMIKAGINAAKKLKIWGVTILTSIDLIEFHRIGFRYSLEKQVQHLAKLANETQVDGVIASPRELYYLRQTLGEKIRIITPSIRMEASGKDPWDDQKRFLTPKEAKERGADFIVVGRPITQSKNPLKAAQEILKEIE